MKVSKLKISTIITLSILTLVLGFACLTYINYINLDIYTVMDNGDITSPKGIKYSPDGKLTSDFMGGDLKSEKIIGRVKGDGFWGRRIWKLKGIASKKSIGLDGLMLQQANTNDYNK